ncbi:hypothetical protein LXL04_035080 [Taraxacum kok-saghyz]
MLSPMASMALSIVSLPIASGSVSLSFSRSCSPTHIPLAASSSSISLASSIQPLIYCGRGDKKTAKGKRFNHSFGNVRIVIEELTWISLSEQARPRNKTKGRGPPRVPVPPAPPRKDRYDDGEVVKIEIDESIFSN